ncbi:DUF418 domain-containing protein [Williamsia soli]|uniref:DUF418 domain-containing protein n=1 Tax=Williamsia soli TaxID=364929 RepID=UPI001A9E69AE|nr:DUF418 domain-containing protein [Williamsia soli]
MKVDRTTRIPGVDVARALAVLGMFAAHILDLDDLRWTDPATYGSLVQGHSAVTFAVLAGVSIALVTGGTRPRTPEQLVIARHQLLVRACCIFLLGGLLQTLGTPILVILVMYSFLFVVALPLLRVPPRTLFIAAGVLAMVMPAIVPPLHAAIGAWGSPYNALSDILISGGYPALIWSAYLLLGLGLGRLDLRSPTVARRMIGFGAGIAAAAYLLSAALVQLQDTVDPDRRFEPPSKFFAPYDNPGEGFRWTWSDLLGLLGADAHSGTPFDVFGSAGISMVVIGGCLILCPRPSPWNFPLRATGMMALTVYSVHIVAVFVLCSVTGRGASGDYPWQNFWTWLLFTAVAIALSSLWIHRFGRGPLERLIASIAVRSSGSRRHTSAVAGQSVE